MSSRVGLGCCNKGYAYDKLESQPDLCVKKESVNQKEGFQKKLLDFQKNHAIPAKRGSSECHSSDVIGKMIYNKTSYRENVKPELRSVYSVTNPVLGGKSQGKLGGVLKKYEPHDTLDAMSVDTWFVNNTANISMDPNATTVPFDRRKEIQGSQKSKTLPFAPPVRDDGKPKKILLHALNTSSLNLPEVTTQNIVDGGLANTSLNNDMQNLVGTFTEETEKSIRFANREPEISERVKNDIVENQPASSKIDSNVLLNEEQLSEILLSNGIIYGGETEPENRFSHQFSNDSNFSGDRISNILGALDSGSSIEFCVTIMHEDRKDFTSIDVRTPFGIMTANDRDMRLEDPAVEEIINDEVANLKNWLPHTEKIINISDMSDWVGDKFQSLYNKIIGEPGPTAAATAATAAATAATAAATASAENESLDVLCETCGNVPYNCCGTLLSSGSFWVSTKQARGDTTKIIFTRGTSFEINTENLWGTMVIEVSVREVGSFELGTFPSSPIDLAYKNYLFTYGNFFVMTAHENKVRCTFPIPHTGLDKFFKIFSEQQLSYKNIFSCYKSNLHKAGEDWFKTSVDKDRKDMKGKFSELETLCKSKFENSSDQNNLRSLKTKEVVDYVCNHIIHSTVEFFSCFQDAFGQNAISPMSFTRIDTDSRKVAVGLLLSGGLASKIGLHCVPCLDALFSCSASMWVFPRVHTNVSCENERLSQVSVIDPSVSFKHKNECREPFNITIGDRTVSENEDKDQEDHYSVYQCIRKCRKNKTVSVFRIEVEEDDGTLGNIENYIGDIDDVFREENERTCLSIEKKCPGVVQKLCRWPLSSATSIARRTTSLCCNPCIRIKDCVCMACLFVAQKEDTGETRSSFSCSPADIDIAYVPSNSCALNPQACKCCIPFCKSYTCNSLSFMTESISKVSDKVFCVTNSEDKRSLLAAKTQANLSMEVFKEFGNDVLSSAKSNMLKMFPGIKNEIINYFDKNILQFPEIVNDYQNKFDHIDQMLRIKYRNLSWSFEEVTFSDESVYEYSYAERIPSNSYEYKNPPRLVGAFRSISVATNPFGEDPPVTLNDVAQMYGKMDKVVTEPGYVQAGGGVPSRMTDMLGGASRFTIESLALARKGVVTVPSGCGETCKTKISWLDPTKMAEKLIKSFCGLKETTVVKNDYEVKVTVMTSPFLNQFHAMGNSKFVDYLPESAESVWKKISEVGVSEYDPNKYYQLHPAGMIIRFHALAHKAEQDHRKCCCASRNMYGCCVSRVSFSESRILYAHAVEVPTPKLMWKSNIQHLSSKFDIESQDLVKKIFEEILKPTLQPCPRKKGEKPPALNSMGHVHSSCLGLVKNASKSEFFVENYFERFVKFAGSKNISVSDFIAQNEHIEQMLRNEAKTANITEIENNFLAYISMSPTGTLTSDDMAEVAIKMIKNVLDVIGYIDAGDSTFLKLQNNFNGDNIIKEIGNLGVSLQASKFRAVQMDIGNLFALRGFAGMQNAWSIAEMKSVECIKKAKKALPENTDSNKQVGTNFLGILTCLEEDCLKKQKICFAVFNLLDKVYLSSMQYGDTGQNTLPKRLNERKDSSLWPLSREVRGSFQGPSFAYLDDIHVSDWYDDYDTTFLRKNTPSIFALEKVRDPEGNLKYHRQFVRMETVEENDSDIGENIV
jgi:hypothetical protein